MQLRWPLGVCLSSAVTTLYVALPACRPNPNDGEHPGAELPSRATPDHHTPAAQPPFNVQPYVQSPAVPALNPNQAVYPHSQPYAATKHQAALAAQSHPYVLGYPKQYVAPARQPLPAVVQPQPRPHSTILPYPQSHLSPPSQSTPTQDQSEQKVEDKSEGSGEESGDDEDGESDLGDSESDDESHAKGHDKTFQTWFEQNIQYPFQKSVSEPLKDHLLPPLEQNVTSPVQTRIVKPTVAWIQDELWPSLKGTAQWTLGKLSSHWTAERIVRVLGGFGAFGNTEELIRDAMASIKKRGAQAREELRHLFDMMGEIMDFAQILTNFSDHKKAGEFMEELQPVVDASMRMGEQYFHSLLHGETSKTIAELPEPTSECHEGQSWCLRDWLASPQGDHVGIEYRYKLGTSYKNRGLEVWKGISAGFLDKFGILFKITHPRTSCDGGKRYTFTLSFEDDSGMGIGIGWMTGSTDGSLLGATRYQLAVDVKHTLKGTTICEKVYWIGQSRVATSLNLDFRKLEEHLSLKQVLDSFKAHVSKLFNPFKKLGVNVENSKSLEKIDLDETTERDIVNSKPTKNPSQPRLFWGYLHHKMKRFLNKTRAGSLNVELQYNLGIMFIYDVSAIVAKNKYLLLHLLAIQLLGRVAGLATSVATGPILIATAARLGYITGIHFPSQVAALVSDLVIANLPYFERFDRQRARARINLTTTFKSSTWGHRMVSKHIPLRSEVAVRLWVEPWSREGLRHG